MDERLKQKTQQLKMQAKQASQQAKTKMPKDTISTFTKLLDAAKQVKEELKRAKAPAATPDKELNTQIERFDTIVAIIQDTIDEAKRYLDAMDTLTNKVSIYTK